MPGWQNWSRKISVHRKCRKRERLDSERMERTMLSYMQKPLDVQEKWYLVNAEGKTLGRLGGPRARQVAGQTPADLYSPCRYGSPYCDCERGKNSSDRQ